MVGHSPMSFMPVAASHPPAFCAWGKNWRKSQIEPTVSFTLFLRLSKQHWSVIMMRRFILLNIVIRGSTEH